MQTFLTYDVYSSYGHNVTFTPREIQPRMRLPYGFRLRRPCHSELVELLWQAAKARGERRRGISGGFAQDDSVGRREDNILPYR